MRIKAIAAVKKFFRNITKLIKQTIDAYKGAKPDSAEGRMVQQMEDIYGQLQEVFAKGVYEGGENDAKTINASNVRDRVNFSRRISDLTDNDILNLIENCNRGEYALRTFIPVRKDTPSILLEKSKQEGLKPLDNRPIIMLVEHVQQCMDDEVAAVDGKRGHALTAQNILDITKGLDHPRYIFYQQDNNKYSLIVEYDVGNRNEKGMAIVDVTRDKNPDQMNGFEGGKYNILVTAYAPDSQYLKKYIKSENNKCIYDKTEDEPQRSSGSLVPSLLNGTPSSLNLAQPEEVVKENDTTATDKIKRSGRNAQSFTEAEAKAIQGIGRKSIHQFNSSDIKATEKLAERYWKEMGNKSPFFRAWFGDWRFNDQSQVQTADIRGDARGRQKNEDTGWNIQVSGQVFNETKTHNSVGVKEARPYLPYINDIVKKAILLDTWGFDQKDIKSENSLLMHSLYAVADIGNGPVILKLYVEEMNDPSRADTSKRAYQLQNIEKAFNASVRVQGKTPSSLTNTKNAIRTVADLFSAVKQQDMNFVPKAPNAVVNIDGMPKVVFHGTSAVFDTFSYGHIGYSTGVGILGDGFYFTDKKNLAKNYGREIYPVYLKMNNPYMASQSDAYKLNTAQLEAQGYDGVILEAPAGNVYMVFNNTQIKSATDNIGTFDGMNPNVKRSARSQQNATVGDMLRQENEQLKADVEQLREMLKLQRTVTNGTKFTKTSVEAAARLLMRSANAKGDVKELAGLLNDLYEHIAGGKELTWESVKEAAQPDSAEGRMVQQMEDIYSQLQEVFAKGVYEGTENTAESVDNTEKIAYSKRGTQKPLFKENVFPPYNESQSQAHELAERWSRSESTQSGERKLISFHNKWYLVEAFDDLKYGYQIIKKLTKQQYIKEASFYETITDGRGAVGTTAGYQSVQDSLGEDAARNYRRSANGNAGYRLGNDASEHRGENRTVHGMGENEVRWGAPEDNGSRDSASSSLDSQGTNGSSITEAKIKRSGRSRSTTDSEGNQLSEGQQEYFTETDPAADIRQRIKFSRRKFSQDVDTIVDSDDNKPFDYRNVFMGETPQSLLDLGFAQLPMTITSKHIYTIANSEGRFNSPNDHYHALGAEGVKQLLDDIKKPIVTFVEKDNPQRVVMITVAKDSDGNPVMAAVECSGQTNFNEVRIFANPLVTAFGKKSGSLLSYIQEALDDGRMLQADKKRSQEAPSGLWAQCPEGLWSSDFTTNIERFKQNVKRFLPKEKQIRKAWRTIEEQQAEKFKAKKSARSQQNATVGDMLKQENEQLKADVDQLKEMLKLQRTVTNGTKFTKTSVEAAARLLMRSANAKGDVKELAGLLNDLYEHIAGGKELTWESVKEAAQPDSAEGRMVQQMEDIYGQLQEVFAKGVYEGGETTSVFEETTERKIKQSTRENTDIPYKQYRMLLNKPQIKKASQYFGKVKDARIEKYRGLSEEQIPDIDFLKIGEYGKLDEGYVYIVRNYDFNTFHIIGRSKIKNRYDGWQMRSDNSEGANQGTSDGDGKSGSAGDGRSIGNQSAGGQRTASGNASRGEVGETVDTRRSFSNGVPDSGRRSGLNKEKRVKKSGRYRSAIDSAGNQLSEGQQEYFKDSKIRNADGNLIPMYHGTMHGGFTVFGGGKDYWYFTNDKKYAYTFEGRKANGQFYPSTKEGIENGYYNPERYKVWLFIGV